MHTLRVELGARSYPIHIGAGLLERAGELLAPHLGGGRALVVADATVARLHGERLLAALGSGARLAEFPAGEPSKTLATAERLWAACAEHRINRNDVIVGFGGGVSGDLAGFVAACWMRGIRFVQVPTTLLAMVDSAVGGKTGVDTSFGKNLVGAFWQPACVLADTTVLGTMDAREYRAGLAEVLKYGVIKEPAFLAWQEAHAAALVARDPGAVAHAVHESCRLKAWYVQVDEHERGPRAELNYGHTFAHALETEAGYAAYFHGEAVGIGMRMATALAARLGVLSDAGLAARQDALLRAYGLPLAHRPAATDEAVRLAGRTALDKKAGKGGTRFVLPVAPGTMRVQLVDDAAAVQAAFQAGFAA